MESKQDKVYTAICKLAGFPVDKKNKNKEKTILLAIKAIEKKIANNKLVQKNTNLRINTILKVVESYAKLNFHQKAPLVSDGHHLDGLSSGINMLGEELQTSTVSLKEKEVLLKEIHHRVKNNLQIISSLLSLQMDTATNTQSVNFFADNIRRIRSMALVHETLYQSKNISEVNFADYLQTLISSIKEPYKNEKAIRLLLKASAHNLKIDAAIPCGLIVNELITNSHKHAFAGKTEGEIMLKFGKEKNGNCKISISDNGIGLPKKFSLEKSTNLGLQLVTLLTEQLDGTLSIKNKTGASFTITFPS